MKTTIGRSVIAISTLALVSTAGAQDARWEPWLGCWEMVRENVRDGIVLPLQDQPALALPTGPQRAAPQVCVRRTGENRVTLRTTVEGQPALEQSIVSDGSESPITDGSCQGSQRAEWSRSGERLVAHAELSCRGQEPLSVSCLSLIAPDGTWLDIRAVRMGARETTRVSRYRRLRSESAVSRLAGPPLMLGDVKEASAKVSPRAVEAALVETNARFDLTSRELIDLDAAKVPANVIDLVVALSYPERFVVERTSRRDSASSVLASDPFLYSSFGFPFG